MENKGIKIWVVVLLVIVFWPAAIVYVAVKSSKGGATQSRVNQAQSVNNYSSNVNPVDSSEQSVSSSPNIDLSKLNMEVEGLLLEVRGMQRILKIYDDRVVLEQIKNARAFLSNNYFAGTKEIYYSDMIGIQTKDASKLILGYIQFETASTNSKDNFNSENSWTYDQRIHISNEIAHKLQEFFRKKMKASKEPKTATIINQVSVAEELLKWKQLYDSGVISEAEFNEKKQQLVK